MDQQSVFISYAHKDGMEITRQLVFSLEMYMDVYWDRHLQSGNFPNQLYEKIEAQDHFLLVMTPHSLESEWCRKELEYAEKKEKSIILARIYSGDGTTDPQLTSKYTYGDFCEDFDVGFRRLTAMMLGTPHSSWEYLTNQTNGKIIETLKDGRIPGIIAKSVAEWVITEKLWPAVNDYLTREKYNFPFIWGMPRTPTGIARQCDDLTEQFSFANDIIGVSLVQNVAEIVEIYINETSGITDGNHRTLGEKATNLLIAARQLLANKAESSLDVPLLASIQSYYWFDVAEKLRELINLHARRSRYLY